MISASSFVFWFGVGSWGIILSLAGFLCLLTSLPVGFFFSSGLYWSSMDRPERFIFLSSHFLFFFCVDFFPWVSRGGQNWRAAD